MTINLNNQTKKKAVKFANPYAPPPGQPSSAGTGGSPIGYFSGGAAFLDKAVADEANLKDFSTNAKAEQPLQTPKQAHPFVGAIINSWYMDIIVYTAEKGKTLRCVEVVTSMSTMDADNLYHKKVQDYQEWLDVAPGRRVYIVMSKIYPRTPEKEGESLLRDFWEGVSPKEKIYVNGPKANYPKGNPSA
jgi:hypothetical protein